MNTRPTLVNTAEGEQLEFAAGGSWTASHAKELEPLAERIARDASTLPMSIDMRAVEEFDTYGAWLLERLIRQHDRRDGGAQILNLPERYRDLYEEMHRANLEKPQAPVKSRKVLVGLETIGRMTAEIGTDLVAIASMLGALCVSLARLFRPP